MEEVALVLATSVGPIAAVLTLPDAEADAVMLIVPGIVRGGGGTRAGVNQVHVRIARAAANHRVATLRADYAGMGESWDADPHRRSAAVGDLAGWACERTGDVPWFSTRTLVATAQDAASPAHATLTRPSRQGPTRERRDGIGNPFDRIGLQTGGTGKPGRFRRWCRAGYRSGQQFPFWSPRLHFPIIYFT